MESIGIETAQNVVIRQPVASLGQRLLAFLVDGLVFFAYAFLLVLLLDSTGGGSTSLGILLSLPILLYFPALEILMNGQTIGKRSLKIRVVKLDGSRPGASAYLLRWLLGVVDYLLVLGGVATLSILLTRNSQRLGDIAAGTTVVREKKKSSILKEQWREMEGLPEDYQPVFPAAQNLNNREVQLALEALQAFRRKGQRAPMERLQAHLEKKMQTGETGLHPIKFLTTVRQDYLYYSLQQAARQEPT